MSKRERERRFTVTWRRHSGTQLRFFLRDQSLEKFRLKQANQSIRTKKFFKSIRHQKL